MKALRAAVCALLRALACALGRVAMPFFRASSWLMPVVCDACGRWVVGELAPEGWTWLPSSSAVYRGTLKSHCPRCAARWNGGAS